MKADLLLVEQVKQGNKQAFSSLVKKHQQILLRLALRMTRDLEMAEDIVQDSFIKAFQKIHMFEGRSSFRSWIYQITLNTAKNRLRSNRYDFVDIEHVNLAMEPAAEDNLVQLDFKKAIQDEVDKLPQKQKLALNLRIFEELSFKEIADVMGCPYDTAKANYRHALMKLRHRFSESVSLSKLQDFDQFFKPAARGKIAEVET